MNDIAEIRERPVDLDSLSDNDLVAGDIARQILGGTTSPISPATLWRGIKANRFPPPIIVGANTHRFRVGALRDCVRAASRVAA